MVAPKDTECLSHSTFSVQATCTEAVRELACQHMEVALSNDCAMVAHHYGTSMLSFASGHRLMKPVAVAVPASGCPRTCLLQYMSNISFSCPCTVVQS
jgi:hypothetical protein